MQQVVGISVQTLVLNRWCFAYQCVLFVAICKIGVPTPSCIFYLFCTEFCYTLAFNVVCLSHCDDATHPLDARLH